MLKLRCVAIIQARMDSRRLPGKVMLPLRGHSGDRPMLWHVVRRVRAATGVDRVVVATSDEASDAPIREFCVREGIECFAGSKDDVLDRFYRAASQHEAGAVIRVTADCPLVDPDLISRVIEFFHAGGYDHFGLATGAGAVGMRERRFPDGLDVECLSFRALSDAWQHASHPGDREHVTPYIWRDPSRFELGVLLSSRDHSDLRWVVDHRADLELVRRVYEALDRADRVFGMEDVLGFLEQNPELAASNRQFIGREGYEALWNPDEEKELV